jgi:hypothetical protein
MTTTFRIKAGRKQGGARHRENALLLTIKKGNQMSGNSDKSLFDNEVRIKGDVISFEKLVSKAGKDWAKLVIERVRKFRDEETVERYEISVFGKAMDEYAGVIKQGESIEAVCRVQADEWKGRWYVKLSLKTVDALRAAPSGDGGAQSGVRQSSSGDGDADLPF